MLAQREGQWRKFRQTYRNQDIAPRSGLQDNLDAALLLVAKFLVELRSVFEASAVGNDEGGIDLALLDEREKLWQVMLNRRLRHAEGEPAIYGRAKRYFVQKAAIHTD